MTPICNTQVRHEENPGRELWPSVNGLFADSAQCFLKPFFVFEKSCSEWRVRGGSGHITLLVIS